jgi:histidinol-phosphatase (PHP family)
MATRAGAAAEPWRVSLHGGHSGEYCDHAEGSLREMLEAAAQFGYHTFGVSEHAPRMADRFLYSGELERGWTVESVAADFERYQSALTPLVRELADRLVVLRGFECEVVPSDRYVELMRGYRERTLPDGRPLFDYCVGSVHYIDEIPIDGRPEKFIQAVRQAGGLERAAVRYYDKVAEMVAALRPEVVGHLDLIKRNVAAAGLNLADLETDAVRRAAVRALEVVGETGGILDLNTAGWRKGLGEPYPAPWLVRQADAMGIGFCFGDDSHRPSDVGAGIDQAAAYLLEQGVRTVTVLTREGDVETGSVVRRTVPLAVCGARRPSVNDFASLPRN